jgi:hypothetical protein
MRHGVERRDLLLRSAAAATTFAAMLGASHGASTAPPNLEDAYQAWRTWDDRQTGPRNLVQSAILAASAHNTQPWLFCTKADRIAISSDEARNLGAMDPFRREMHISIGCALQNLLLEARAQGQHPQLVIAPGTLAEPLGQTQPRTVAVVELSAAPAFVSPLRAGIPRRHTNRAAFEVDRPIGGDVLAELTGLVEQDAAVRLWLLTDAAARADFAAATAEATQAIINDPIMIGDSDAWFRATNREIAIHRDGPTIDAAGLSPLLTWLAKILPAPSAERAHRIWLEQTRDIQLASAPLFGLIAVKDLYDRAQAVQAGMLWQRLHLKAALVGLGAQPLNQLPERVDRERQLGEPARSAKLLAAVTGDPTWLVTFAFRIGWPTRAPGLSPRRDLEAVISPASC